MPGMPQHCQRSGGGRREQSGWEETKLRKGDREIGYAPQSNLGQGNIFIFGDTEHAKADAASSVKGDRFGYETGRTVGYKERGTDGSSNFGLGDIFIFRKLIFAAAAGHA